MGKGLCIFRTEILSFGAGSCALVVKYCRLCRINVRHPLAPTMSLKAVLQPPEFINRNACFYLSF